MRDFKKKLLLKQINMKSHKVQIVNAPLVRIKIPDTDDNIMEMGGDKIMVYYNHEAEKQYHIDKFNQKLRRLGKEIKNKGLFQNPKYGSRRRVQK